MNDKLKREFNKIKIGNKNFCVKVCVSDYSEDTELLDEIAVVLEREISFIQLEQGACKDGEFKNLADKVSQLVSMYDGTLVLRGSLAVSYFTEPDGVVLSDDDLSISNVQDLLGKNISIGYCCKDEESIKSAIKRGADYIILSTPSISTNNVVIEYAKWVYENTETPVFLEVDSQKNYATLTATNIDKFILSINHLDSILHTP